MLGKIARSAVNASKGLCQAYKKDKSFRLEVSVGLPLFLVVGSFLWPLGAYEIILLVLAYGLILMSELINTSVERLLERLHPEAHDLIGESKDIAAGAVLIAFVVAGIVVVTLLLIEYGVWI